MASCSISKVDENKLASDFIFINRDLTFDELFNVIISTRTMRYNHEIGLYQPEYYLLEIYDTLSGDYVLFPMIDYPGTEPEITRSFVDCDYECQSFLTRKYGVLQKEELEIIYKDLIRNIMNEYRKIELPEYFGYENLIQLKGNPGLGDFIQFKLNTNTTCYYLDNVDGLKTEYWVDTFRKIEKIDEHWYYKIGTID